MPKKDNKPNPKASTSKDEDPKPPTKSTGAIPKSHSYAGPQETEARRHKRATAAMSEDESDNVAAGVWTGRTRSSAKPQPEEGTRRGLFSRMRSKSKSRSPTKREKSKSKSPARKDKGKRTKSPSPHRSLFGRMISKSPTKRDPSVEEEPEEEESSDDDEEERRERITPMQELKTIMESSTKTAKRSLTVRPGPDTVQLIETPPDSIPLVSKADLLLADLGKRPDSETCIEIKSAPGTPVEDDLTNTSSASMSSLVQGNLQLDDDSQSLKSEASGGKPINKGKKK